MNIPGYIGSTLYGQTPFSVPYKNHKNAVITGVIIDKNGYFKLILKYINSRGIKRPGTANEPIVNQMSIAYVKKCARIIENNPDIMIPDFTQETDFSLFLNIFIKSLPMVNPDAKIKLSIVDMIIDIMETIKMPANIGFNALLINK